MPITALVTGATAGIGYHTAAGLAARGARVLVTGRDESRGRAVARELSSTAPGRVEFLAVEHATVGANLVLARGLLDRLDRLDLLVNNVGALHERRQVTADGYEATLAVNFVAPAALTDALRPLLTASRRPRVVDVVSGAYRMWRGDPFEDLHSERSYVGLTAYARAKLLTVLAAVHTATGERNAAAPVRFVLVNPGMAWTPMTQALTPRAVPPWRWIWPLVRLVQRRRSPVAAAGNVLRAVDGTAEPGSVPYWDGGRRTPLTGLPAIEDAPRRAAELAAALVRTAPTASSAGPDRSPGNR